MEKPGKFYGSSHMKGTAMDEEIGKMTFEEAMGALEKLVVKMESGEVKLADTVAYYERGTALKKHLESMLADAKMKIEKVELRPDGKAELKEFE
jgi:exodeoxyribonuclease VII small subunit